MSAPLVRTVLGTMEIGRRMGVQDSKIFLKIFNRYQQAELDSAFMYSGGQTEEHLGEIRNEVNRDFLVATKANPWDSKGLGKESVRNQLETSLKRLKARQVDLFYLHAPDHDTPLTETLEAVNVLQKEGKFLRFGLSNYPSWQVAEIYNICKQNGWIMPSVYQGMYSALTRKVEEELIPCLRYFGIAFYAFSPLGGGFLTGKHKFEDPASMKKEQGRFFGETVLADLYRSRYWKKEYVEAIEMINAALASAYGEGTVSVPEAAYRWLYHHSALRGDCRDAVVVGASSPNQLEQNLEYTVKGPLDEKVVEVIESVWNKTSHLCPEYAR